MFVLDECDKMLDQIGKSHVLRLHPSWRPCTNRAKICVATFRRSSVRLRSRSRS
jgi:hypothetical protein